MLNKIFRIFSVSTIGKILGFVKIQLLTSYYGANSYTDAIIIVMNIYWFWSNEVIYSLFSNTLIPKLSKTNLQDQQVNQTLTVLVSSNFLSIFFLFASVFLAKLILTAFAPMATSEFFDVAVQLMILLSPLALLIPITEIFTLHNQFKEYYLVSSVNMAVWNIFQISAIFTAQFFLNKIYVVYLFGIFTIISYLITSFVQLRTSNYFAFFKLKDLFKVSLMKFKLSVLDNFNYFVSTVLFQINVYINYAFISKLRPGSITIYDIVLKIPNVFQSVLMSSLTIIFFNAISKNSERAVHYFWKFTSGLFLVMVPLLLLAKLFGVAILNLIYGHKVFLNHEGILLVLFCGFINIYFMGKISLLIKSIIINQKGKSLLFSTILATIFNAVFNYYAVDYYGLGGVILVTVIINFILCIILQFNVFFKNQILTKFILFDILTIIIASLIYFLV